MKTLRSVGVMCMLLTCVSVAQAQFIHPEAYKIDKKDVRRAQEIMNAPVDKETAMPNPAPGAQWFPDASLGLFMHWGIHSVVGAQPSWDMISNYIWGGKVAPPSKYYALADQFNPTDYHPDRYLKAAKEAGFTYAVMTTKHHDGYALWPSKYGIGTKQYMNGRDLIGEYIAACRANGLKVGLYFSPRDWNFPGIMDPCEFDDRTRHLAPPITDSAANNKRFEQFMGFVITQMEELLTRYGKIDVLWLDGMGWRGVSDMHTEQIYAWLRKLQPDMVINDRWANIINPDDPGSAQIRVGDFTTPFECTYPTYVPSKWWDHCDIWTSASGPGWGYDKTGSFRSFEWFFDHLSATRSLGGNFLINVGPSGSGDMHPNYYKQVEAIAQWMKHSRESVIGVGVTPGVERSNVKLTSRGNVWYAHLMPSMKKSVSVKTDKKPVSVTLLRTGEAVTYGYRDGFVVFTVDPSQRTEMDDVVKITL